MREIKYKSLADELETEDNDSHVRSWLNKHLEELDFKIISACTVEFDCYISFIKDILIPILNYSSRYSNIQH